MSTARISFQHVTKVFKTQRQRIVAVEDYNMEVQEGEFISIIGPSGCGKSTLIRMLDGIIKPTSGAVCVDGVDYAARRLPRSEVQKIGFIFQQPNLLPWRTIRQNVALPLQVFHLSGDEWQKRVDDLIDMVGMTDHASAYPIEVSRGMTQRVGVIRAMVHDPEILLMDEPFGALDGITREQLDMELLGIWERTGKTIIFITHNVEEAVLLSSRVYVMGTQPGRLTNVVDIDIPRPRSLQMIHEKGFQAYTQQLLGMIGELDISTIK